MRKINTFWNWFQDNNQIIRNIINDKTDKQNQILHWFNKQLGYYCKDLDFIIIYPKKQDQKTELIITANGNPEYFNLVNELINKAPTLRHWKFTAFIQPKNEIDKIINELDDQYIIPEITIKTRNIKFLPIDKDEKAKKTDIILYLKNYSIYCNNKTLEQAIYIIIEDLLGEKLIYQNINFVQLAQMPNDKGELIHLYELQFFVDTMNGS